MYKGSMENIHKERSELRASKTKFIISLQLFDADGYFLYMYVCKEHLEKQYTLEKWVMPSSHRYGWAQIPKVTYFDIFLQKIYFTPIEKWTVPRPKF